MNVTKRHGTFMASLRQGSRALAGSPGPRDQVGPQTGGKKAVAEVLCVRRSQESRLQSPAMQNKSLGEWSAP
jgi:hypothetical protein